MLTFKKILLISLLMVSSLSYASPKIFAHRGGGKEFPENTIKAFKNSLENGADGIELDVQLSKDKVIMLYHPADLSIWTEAKGIIADYNSEELKKLDAAYNFDPEADKSFPLRNQGYKIATLAEAIDELSNQEIIVDLKSLPANELIDAIIKLVDEKQAWDKLVFYSTNDEHLNYFKQHKPIAQLFESRNITRQRLLTLRNDSSCCCQNHNVNYIGFELDREMLVEESFALGKASNKIHFKLWDTKAVDCTKNSTSKHSKIFFFGINNKQDYEEAAKLGAYAVFSDKPTYISNFVKTISK